MMAHRAEALEYRAAHEAAAFSLSTDRAHVRVVGPDRVSYLQGMCSNDVVALAEGGSLYATFLTAKGAMVADGRVLKRADELLVDAEPGRGEGLLAFLQQYLISEDAEVSLAQGLAVVHLAGPGAEALASRLPAEAVLGQLVPLSPGVDVLVKGEALGAVEAALAGVPRLSAGTLEVLRVEAGVPRFGVDMTESTIPLEANLERALHYKKGCYIGQEVIARATYRGQMNKKLVGLLLGGLEVGPGTELRTAEKRVGYLTTVVHSPARQQVLALGYVRRDFLTPGTRLDVAGGGQAEVVGLPVG